MAEAPHDAEGTSTTHGTPVPQPSPDYQAFATTKASATDTAEAILSAAKSTFGHLVIGLNQIKWEELPEKVKQHIKDNPKMTAFQAVMLLVTFVPGSIVAPALGLLGFSSIGPVAGSAAAGYQSVHGATIGFRVLQSAAMGGYGATIGFRVLQSAAMGGYGAATVNGVVTGVSATAGVVTG